MQRASKIYELQEIINKLEELNKYFNSKAISRAIEELKIALNEEIRRSGERLSHFLIKKQILEKLSKEYSFYLEAESTGLIKLGYRPDIVLLNDKELLIIEIETKSSNALKKLRKIEKIFDKIKTLPITTNRNIRIKFFIIDKNNEILNKLAKKLGIEIEYVNKNDILNQI